jgi:membrane-bound serine protease (ClpP class)
MIRGLTSSIFVLLLSLLVLAPVDLTGQPTVTQTSSAPTVPVAQEGFVARIAMDMAILPGTEEYLRDSIEAAAASGAKILIVELTTPGGLLPTTQAMVQEIFRAPIPVVVYVSPSGGSATSAGVFITLAAHVAAMAPGTTIGAAHPVSGDGSDIQGDMRAKVESMAVAMVKSVAEQRGRNVAWAEKAVRESASLTEQEAVSQGVVDLVATDINSLLKGIRGKRVKVQDKELLLEDYSELPIREFDISLRQRATNVLANPQVAALLWLVATGGISIELYHPGLIVPGMVGVIALVLALGVSQIIPISMIGVGLLVVGGILIALEFLIPSGILGIGGIVALVMGTLYLFDPSMLLGISIDYTGLVFMALLMGGTMLGVSVAIARSRRQVVRSGYSDLVGQRGKTLSNVAGEGQIFVNGEVWRAVSLEGIIEQNADVEVVGVQEGLTLEVRKVLGE